MNVQLALWDLRAHVFFIGIIHFQDKKYTVCLVYYAYYLPQYMLTVKQPRFSKAFQTCIAKQEQAINMKKCAF